MSAVSNNLLIAGDDGYTIERSVRLRSSASAYLNRTPASAGNRKTWTWSGWVKRGGLGVNVALFGAYTSSATNSEIFFNSDDKLHYWSEGASTVLAYTRTDMVFRDTSAWYHIVVTYNSTEAVQDDRLKIYVNGSSITYTNVSGVIGLNEDSYVNDNTRTHALAYSANNGTYFDGYITEVNFIDGRTPNTTTRVVNGVTQTILTELGEYDEDTGVWKPAKYTGTYGTNGFYLDFSDNTTTTTLAADASGNGNDWTANNISLTSGATYDSMTDTPTIYEDGGNYAVMNPLVQDYELENGNLKVRTLTSYSGAKSHTSSMALGLTGKYYFEYTVLQQGSGAGSSKYLGLCSSGSGDGIASDNSIAYYGNGSKRIDGGSTTSYGSSWALDGRVVGVAADCDTGEVTFYMNGVSQGAITYNAGGFFAFIADSDSSYSTIGEFNFGQRPFAYTPPTGFKALHTGNLPDSAIVDGSKYFDVLTWNGDGASTRSIGSLEFQPDFVWGKVRNNTFNHWLYDSVRGASLGLKSNATDAEITNAVNGYVSAFNSDGFDITAGTSNTANLNGLGGSYVGWNWKANGTGVSNTDGSITSTVSANPTAGFSIVTYTGNGSAGATFGHGLGVAPKMVIVKPRSSSGDNNWKVYHASIGGTGALYFNLTNATSTSSVFWNNTSPTSTTVTVGSAASPNYTNQSGIPYVAYCFSEVDGYSKFGSYTGNGSADGPFVYCGFRPALIMAKLSTTAGYWDIIDTSRDPYNAMVNELYPNVSSAENGVAITTSVDCLSNGFKIRTSDANWNSSGQTIIYMAFAENPFKYSLAR